MHTGRGPRARIWLVDPYIRRFGAPEATRGWRLTPYIHWLTDEYKSLFFYHCMFWLPLYILDNLVDRGHTNQQIPYAK
jgi:hypothetical protein